MSSIKPRCRSMFAMHSLECAPGRRPATTLWKEDVQRQRRSERRRTPPTSSRDPPPPKKPDRSRTRQMSRWTVVSEACSPNSSCAQRFGTKNTLDETQPWKVEWKQQEYIFHTRLKSCVLLYWRKRVCGEVLSNSWNPSLAIMVMKMTLLVTPTIKMDELY